MLALNTDKMLAEKDNGIGWITFNNPARRNAMSMEMWEALSQIVDDFSADDSVRVVVMKGAGDKAFVSGADISQFEKVRANAEAAEEYARISDASREKLASIQKPLIAMVRGYCLGGGLALAMVADMRFVSDDSQLGIPAARLSIAYSPLHIRRLISLVGPAYARDILFSARRVPADEALRIGLVNRVVPAAELEAMTRDYAATIVDNAPLSILASKLTIADLLKDPADRDPALVAELGRRCFDSQDYKEGRTAFMEKRSPVFTGR